MEASFVGECDGERLDRENRSFRLLAQLPDLEVVEGTFEYGWEGVDPHIHSDHTDSFYVIEGEVEFLVDGE
jgi:quercetin dioxygenase-like cupin family protein